MDIITRLTPAGIDWVRFSTGLSPEVLELCAAWSSPATLVVRFGTQLPDHGIEQLLLSRKSSIIRRIDPVFGDFKEGVRKILELDGCLRKATYIQEHSIALLKTNHGVHTGSMNTIVLAELRSLDEDFRNKVNITGEQLPSGPMGDRILAADAKGSGESLKSFLQVDLRQRDKDLKKDLRAWETRSGA